MFCASKKDSMSFYKFQKRCRDDEMAVFRFGHTNMRINDFIFLRPLSIFQVFCTRTISWRCVATGRFLNLSACIWTDEMRIFLFSLQRVGRHQIHSNAWTTSLCDSRQAQIDWQRFGSSELDRAWSILKSRAIRILVGFLQSENQWATLWYKWVWWPLTMLMHEQ